MKDIFENGILCNKCKAVMTPIQLEKNGFILRAVKCKKCGEIILHPVDNQEYENFINLKKKEFNVKMRMVGNSYAVSIPRQIVDFMREQEKMMNDMVKLCFEDAKRISLSFDANREKSSRVIKAQEYKVVKNNQPVFHIKQFSDSANPQNNKTKIFKSNKVKYIKEDDR